MFNAIKTSYKNWEENAITLQSVHFSKGNYICTHVFIYWLQLIALTITIFALIVVFISLTFSPHFYH